MTDGPIQYVSINLSILVNQEQVIIIFPFLVVISLIL